MHTNNFQVSILLHKQLIFCSDHNSIKKKQEIIKTKTKLNVLTAQIELKLLVYILLFTHKKGKKSSIQSSHKPIQNTSFNTSIF